MEIRQTSSYLSSENTSPAAFVPLLGAGSRLCVAAGVMPGKVRGRWAQQWHRGSGVSGSVSASSLLAEAVAWWTLGLAQIWYLGSRLSL